MTRSNQWTPEQKLALRKALTQGQASFQTPRTVLTNYREASSDYIHSAGAVLSHAIGVVVPAHNENNPDKQINLPEAFRREWRKIGIEEAAVRRREKEAEAKAKAEKAVPRTPYAVLSERFKDVDWLFASDAGLAFGLNSHQLAAKAGELALFRSVVRLKAETFYIYSKASVLDASKAIEEREKQAREADLARAKAAVAEVDAVIGPKTVPLVRLTQDQLRKQLLVALRKGLVSIVQMEAELQEHARETAEMAAKDKTT